MPNLLVALGIVLSAKYCAESVTRVETAPLAVAIAVAGGMLFLAQIRFMDELLLIPEKFPEAPNFSWID